MTIEVEGFEVLRGVLEHADVEALNETLEIAFSHYPAHIGAGTPQATGYAVHRWVCVADLERQLAIPSAFHRVVRKLADAAPPFSLFKAESSFLKRIAPDEYAAARIDWHRDADAAGTWHYVKSVNIWVPLQAVGANAPSIEFIPGSHRQLRAVPSKFQRCGAYETANDSVIATTVESGAPSCPSLCAGDVVIFDHHTLHRTQTLSSAIERRSFECRFQVASPARFAVEKIKGLVAPLTRRPTAG